MGFGRRRQQFFRCSDRVVDFNRRFHYRLAHGCERFREITLLRVEVPFDDIVEDTIERILVEGLHVEHVEMAQVPHRDIVSATGRRKHRRDENDVLQRFPFFRFQVVPAAFVHPLTQQFDRRLCAVLLLRRHVQIVDENHDVSFPFFRAIHALTPTRTHFRFNQLLDLGSVISKLSARVTEFESNCMCERD